MAGGLAEEFVERHSALPDKQSASGPELFRELGQTADARTPRRAL